jgi:hypothetical protein
MAERSLDFAGWIVWLTPEQGARRDGPPEPRQVWPHYSANGYVPPDGVATGLASLVVRGLDRGAWRSPAEACWLVGDNSNQPWVEVGTVIVVAEGPRPVGFSTVEALAE